MRRLLVLLLIGLLAAGFLALPTAEAQRIGTTNVRVFAIDPVAEVALGEPVTYRYALHNDGTVTFLVETRVVDTTLDVTAATEPSFFFLAPGESDTINLVIQAPLVGPRGTADVTVVFRATNLVTEEVGLLQVTAQVTLLGVTPEEDPRGKVLGVWPNPFPPPLDTPVGAFLFSLVVWIAVALGIIYLIGPVLHGVTSRTQTDIDDVVLRILRGPVFLLVLVYGAVSSVEVLGVPGEVQVFLQRAYGFALILLLTWVTYRIFRDVLVAYGRRLSARAERDIQGRLIPALEKVGGLVIIVLGLVLAVQSLGYDITLFLAGMGVLGLILAFAAQDTLSNFFAGLHIMLDRPFQVGDLIEVEPGVVCEVVDIGLRSTKLYWGKDHDILIIPNREIANKKIINYLRPDFRFRTHVEVGVAYGTDLDEVERVLREIVAAHPDTLVDADHDPLFRVTEFADSAINVMIIFWVKDARLQWDVRSDVLRAIDKRFAEAGIVIPFPQRDVWLKREGPGSPPPGDLDE